MSDTGRNYHTVVVITVAWMMLAVSLVTPIKWWYLGSILAFAGIFKPNKWTSITAVGILLLQVALARAHVSPSLEDTFLLMAHGPAFTVWIAGFLRVRRARRNVADPALTR